MDAHNARGRSGMQSLLLTLSASFALSLPHAQARPQKAKTTNAKRCVSFSQKLAKDEGGINITLASQCSAEVSCTVQWERVCTSASGEVDSASQRRTETLLKDGRWEVHASIDSCDFDWQIKDVRWTCEPT